MKEQERIEYIKYRLEKAEETFEVAELLAKHEKWNSVVNRLYYASFYAITALLVKTGIETKSHAGVKTQFFIHYIKTGMIERHLGKLYGDLFDWRQKGDYGDFFDFTKEDVTPLIAPTRMLMDTVKAQIYVDNS